MHKSTPRLLTSLAALSCIGTLVCWASAPLFIKYLTGYLDLWTQNLLRYVAACLFWLPILLIAAKKGQLPKAVWKRALLPFIPNIFMQNLWTAAFYHIDPGLASLLSMTAFLWAIILSVIFFADERHHLSNRLFWLSIFLSILGLLGVVFFNPAFTMSYTIIGISVTLLYGLLWGIYAVSVKVAFRGIDSRIGFSVVSIYTIVVLVILEIFMGQPGKCLEMPFSGWFAIIISGITGIALGHVFYYMSLRRLGATTPSLVQLAQPFIVVVISYFVFSEKLSVPQLVFGVVLVAGSAMAILSKKDDATTSN
ncbi:MAG: DMT family transporter [Sedimentisphaerales bacterium]|jgi:drug/metabolite transporter (DMT)-like permease